MGDPALVAATWGVVAVSGWFARAQIAAQRETERVRLAVIRRDRYESEEIQRSRRRLAWELFSSSDEALKQFDPSVPNFFDVTGALLRKGYLAKDLVESFFGYAARRYWRGLEPTLQVDSAQLQQRESLARLPLPYQPSWGQCSDK
jgi:hypothetical protein